MRFIFGLAVGLVQALALAILLAWLLKSEGAFVLLFVLAWPLLAWRNLRKPRPSQQRPPLLRRSIPALLALPVVLSFPVFALVSSVSGYAGGPVGLVALAFLLCAYVACWGAAFVAFLAHLGSRRKAP